MSISTQTVQSLTTVQELLQTVHCSLSLPDHTQLTGKDRSFVKIYQEPP